MSKPLMSLCAVPPVTTRDGWTGGLAKVYLPFYGYWFASGARYVFPSATITQPVSRTMGGHTLPDTFQKDCCSLCLGH